MNIQDIYNTQVVQKVKKVIHNVDTFCKKEKKGLQIPLEKTLNRSAALTVICSSTMKPLTSITSLTPVSSVSAKHLEKVTVNGCDQGVIRRTIKNMYVEWRIPPTLTNITTALQESIGYSGGREHSRMHLKRIGFSYKKCESNRKETIKKT